MKSALYHIENLIAHLDLKIKYMDMKESAGLRKLRREAKALRVKIKRTNEL